MDSNINTAKPVSMTLAVMQPYFLPYIGYFQLINTVDTFVIYDDVSFINRGWVNRNRLLMNGQDVMFTVPLKDASQNKRINEILITDDPKWRSKTLKTIEQAYRKAPQYACVFPIIEHIVSNPNNHLSEFLLESLLQIKNYLQIPTQILATSSIYTNTHLKAQERILDICKQTSASHYINPIGGMELYDKQTFDNQDIKLSFIKAKSVVYSQFKNDFVPYLSILDVLMFNDLATVRGFLQDFELV
jgi:WbqC-like protein family